MGYHQGYWLLPTNGWQGPVAEANVGHHMSLNTEKLSWSWLAFMVLEVWRVLPEETGNCRYLSATILEAYSDLLAWHTDAIVAHMVWNQQPLYNGFKALSMWWNLYLMLLKWPRTWDWKFHGPQAKQEHSNKMTPMTYCYVHRAVLH